MKMPRKPDSFIAATARVHMFRMAMGSWWRRIARPHLRKIGAWLLSKRVDIYFLAGWGLITWAFAGWRGRVWAASMGSYFISMTIITTFGEYIEGKREQRAVARRQQ